VTDQQVEQVVSAIKGITEALSWISLILFLIMLNTCTLSHK
jgi:hypothetical protein